MGARAAELLAAERATTTEWGLNIVKVHLVETEEVLQKSLEALEVEQKAWSDTKQEVVVLRG